MIDAEMDRRLREESKRTGTSVGEIVRRAIDQYLPRGLDRRAEAARFLLESTADPGPGREPDWEIQKEEMLNEWGDSIYGDR